VSHFSYWAGLDTPGASQSEVRRFNEFYWSTHVPEVLAHNPGFVRCDRYELVQPDERGDLGPRWLTRYTMDAAAATQYVDENSRPGYVMPYTAFPALGCQIIVRWRLLWEQLASSGDATFESKRIRVIGMDPSDQSTGVQLREFNEFYDDVHLLEARLILGATHAARFELARSFLASVDMPPRYAALYELDGPSRAPETWTSQLSTGPLAWENRNTQWRLEYERIESPVQ